MPFLFQQLICQLIKIKIDNMGMCCGKFNLRSRTRTHRAKLLNKVFLRPQNLKTGKKQRSLRKRREGEKTNDR